VNFCTRLKKKSSKEYKDFLGKNAQKLPHFEEENSEVTIFGQ
jgi:hypothetical protein